MAGTLVEHKVEQRMLVVAAVVLVLVPVVVHIVAVVEDIAVGTSSGYIVRTTWQVNCVCRNQDREEKDLLTSEGC